VRQALFQLERQGIVLREKNIGATVRFYSAEEVRQIYEVREMLTRQAALMIPLPAPLGLIEQLTELAAALLREGRRAGSARHP
jgi:DNA-binding GntR family transcriptional regulator